MFHAGLHRAFHQRARVGGVVAVVAERIGDRFRHHDRCREMDHLGDVVVLHQLADGGLIAGVADDQRDAFRHRPFEPGGEVVEHDDALARVDQRVDHMAADIAGPARHQNCHVGCPFWGQGSGGM